MFMFQMQIKKKQTKKRDRLGIIDIGMICALKVMSARGPSQLAGLAVALLSWESASSRHRCIREADLLVPSPHIWCVANDYRTHWDRLAYIVNTE